MFDGASGLLLFSKSSLTGSIKDGSVMFETAEAVSTVKVGFKILGATETVEGVPFLFLSIETGFLFKRGSLLGSGILNSGNFGIDMEGGFFNKAAGICILEASGDLRSVASLRLLRTLGSL